MLSFLLNQREVTTQVPRGTSLVEFLRLDRRLTGTKVGCKEGDCGACAVLVGEPVNGTLRYRAMASCIMPLGNVEGRHLVTVEGLNLQELTPIQEIFKEEGAVQCGFCTSGFLVSLAGFCLGDKPITYDNAIAAVSGNICRCTGYKAIERAIARIVEGLAPLERADRMSWLVDNQYLPRYFLEANARVAALPKAAPSEPAPGQETLLMGGGTDLLVQEPFRVEDAHLKQLVDYNPFKEIRFENGLCWVGGAATVTDLRDSPVVQELIPNIGTYTKLVSSTLIRNMASVAGNIANGSPIGDLSVLLIALDATLVMNRGGVCRELPVKEFFTGYKQVNKADDEVIEWICFKAPSADFCLNFEKISKRVHLDMATVNSAMGFRLENGLIRDASFAVGGLGATVRSLDKTCAFLEGKPVSDETFRAANEVAQSEITPRSRAEYKRLLVRQMLYLHLSNSSPEALSLEVLQ